MSTLTEWSIDIHLRSVLSARAQAQATLHQFPVQIVTFTISQFTICALAVPPLKIAYASDTLCLVLLDYRNQNNFFLPESHTIFK